MLRLPLPTEDTPTLAELDAALGGLRADTAPAWGTMNAVQMVRHNARFIDLYLGRIAVGVPVRWIARAVGPMFLKRVIKGSPFETPRNLRTLGQIRSAPDLEADLDAEIAALRAQLAEMADLAGVVDHPLYGRAEAESCRTLVRHHLAHHLHQFGLLGPP